MRLWFIFFLLILFYGNDWRMASGQIATPIVPPSPVNSVHRHMAFPVYAYPPPVIYQPRIYYQPYQYIGSSVSEIRYPTPIRSRLFGNQSIQNYYQPMERR